MVGGPGVWLPGRAHHCLMHYWDFVGVQGQVTAWGGGNVVLGIPIRQHISIGTDASSVNSVNSSVHVLCCYRHM